VPILIVLSDGAEHSSAGVIRELLEGGKFFPDLSDLDRRARYKSSHRLICEIVIHFARENLVLRGELEPPGTKAGNWKISEKGSKRLEDISQRWKAMYSLHRDAVLIEDGEGRTL
jgi:hypothetical protein